MVASHTPALGPNRRFAGLTRGAMWTTIATLVFAAAMGTSATEAADNPAITTVDLPAVATPWPGKIVVSNDEWPLSDYGFAVAPDARRFALNLAAWFTGGRPGSFLVYSTNGGLTGFELAETMRGAGHTWHVTTNVGVTLEALLDYDAVFVGGGIVANNVLIGYVRADREAP